MSRMFANYNKTIETAEVYWPTNEPEMLRSAPNVSFLSDIKNRIYGIEAKYLVPFNLYFHLDELTGKPLADLIANSSVSFRILNKGTHKIIVEKSCPASTIYSETSSDLIISIDSEDMKKLKQETYTISLTLQNDSEFYNLFSEADSLLVVR